VDVSLIRKVTSFPHSKRKMADSDGPSKLSLLKLQPRERDNPPGVGPQELRELQSIFLALGGSPTDKTISIESLLSLLNARKASPSQGNDVLLRCIVSAMEAFKSSHPDVKVITFDRFVELCSFSKQDPQSLEKRLMVDLEQVFHLFDEEGKGGIGIQDIRKVVDQFGEPLSDDDIEDMVNRADLDKDGLVNQQEFMAMLNQKPL
jgi:Ca2+-binding EF-hand superfamily protein